MRFDVVEKYLTRSIVNSNIGILVRNFRQEDKLYLKNATACQFHSGLSNRSSANYDGKVMGLASKRIALFNGFSWFSCAIFLTAGKCFRATNTSSFFSQKVKLDDSYGKASATILWLFTNMSIKHHTTGNNW